MDARELEPWVFRLVDGDRDDFRSAREFGADLVPNAIERFFASGALSGDVPRRRGFGAKAGAIDRLQEDLDVHVRRSTNRRSLLDFVDRTNDCERLQAFVRTS